MEQETSREQPACKTLIVVFSPIRWSENLLQYLRKQSHSVESIIGVYLIERRLIEQRARKWMTEGWLGADTTHTVVETLVDDFRKRADHYFQQLEKATGRTVERIILEQDMVEGVLQLARTHSASCIVLVRRVRPRWLRRILNTEGERLANRAPCPVFSIEPET